MSPFEKYFYREKQHMIIKEDRETEWQHKTTANSQYGPEFELETKHLTRTGHLNHAQNTVHI